MKRFVCLSLVFLAALACSFPDMYEYEPQIVVEGWIENDGYPVVRAW